MMMDMGQRNTSPLVRKSGKGRDALLFNNWDQSSSSMRLNDRTDEGAVTPETGRRMGMKTVWWDYQFHGFLQMNEMDAPEYMPAGSMYSIPFCRNLPIAPRVFTRKGE